MKVKGKREEASSKGSKQGEENGDADEDDDDHHNHQAGNNKRRTRIRRRTSKRTFEADDKNGMRRRTRKKEKDSRRSFKGNQEAKHERIDQQPVSQPARQTGNVIQVIIQEAQGQEKPKDQGNHRHHSCFQPSASSSSAI